VHVGEESSACQEGCEQFGAELHTIGLLDLASLGIDEEVYYKSLMKMILSAASDRLRAGRAEEKKSEFDVLHLGTANADELRLSKKPVWRYEVEPLSEKSRGEVLALAEEVHLQRSATATRLNDQRECYKA
jgi:hypothetical protein